MANLKPAFKAFDMQALINKINKTIVAPLPAKYSGSFRGLIKSMLRKNPEVRPSALDLLRHPHLQPYVLDVKLKLNNLRHKTLPPQLPDSKRIMKKAHFSEPAVTCPAFGERRHSSLWNDRAVNPEAEEDTASSIKCMSHRISDLSIESSRKGTVICKQVASSVSRASEFTLAKTSAKPRRFMNPVSGGTTSKIIPSARRTSLPLTKRATTQEATAYNPTFGILQNVKSPEVSINEPQVDTIGIFLLAPYEQDIFFTPMQRKTSSKCSFISDRSITKDKCTVQTHTEGSSSSDQNATAGASSQTTSSNTRRCQFDPSSYRQRADALEGLLEFSARLLQEGRYNELNVLLKPFGPGKVSPRETAIWIAKSLKENRDKTKTADLNVPREIPPVGLL